MLQMHWSWDELQATPMYVRRYCADFLLMRNEARARAVAPGRK
jgi:hypothetical protein